MWRDVQIISVQNGKLLNGLCVFVRNLVGQIINASALCMISFYPHFSVLQLQRCCYIFVFPPLGTRNQVRRSWSSVPVVKWGTRAPQRSVSTWGSMRTGLAPPSWAWWIDSSPTAEPPSTPCSQTSAPSTASSSASQTSTRCWWGILQKRMTQPYEILLLPLPLRQN